MIPSFAGEQSPALELVGKVHSSASSLCSMTDREKEARERIRMSEWPGDRDAMWWALETRVARGSRRLERNRLL
jgi:hypothetical protein